MLSGVASDEQVKLLAGRFSNGELVRMLNLLATTKAAFSKSASRRLETELCLINLCQPELSLEADALNSRLTRLEERLATGDFVAPAGPQKTAAITDADDDDRPPMPGDEDAPPLPEESVAPADEAPTGFWMDLAIAIKNELKPPLSGFFAASPNAPIQGVVRGDELVLECSNSFIMDMIAKPDVLSLAARKASAKLGRNVRAVAVDISAKPKISDRMDQLLNFGRAHGNVVKIKEN